MKFYSKIKHKIKRYFWISVPYFSLTLALVVSFLISTKITNSTWNNLFLSISANIASVIIVYFLYEIIKAKSKKELNKEVFEYAKRFADKDIHEILYKLSKFFFGFQRGRMLTESTKLLRYEPEELEEYIKSRKFIGFELFKSWNETYEYFSKILENNFVLSRLDDNQILVLLEIQSTLINMKRCFENKNGFVDTKQKVTNYIIQDGKSMNPTNSEFPNRYLLLRDIDNGKYVVEDFGDFAPIDAQKLLNVYTISPEAVDPIVMWTYMMFQHIKRWLELTGNHLYIGLE